MIYRRLFDFPTWNVRSPFEQLDQIRRQMDRLYGDIGRGAQQGGVAGVFPLINLSEDKDKYYIRAELPGIKADELEIQAIPNQLSISGERKIASEAETVKYHRREREAGKFSRVIGLPTDIDTDKVEAELANGVLTVSVPKAAASKPKQISIKS